MSAFDVFRKPLTLRHPKTGSYNSSGEWQETYDEITILASVQPATPDDLKALPENRRQSESYVIYTDTELQASGSMNPDKVIINDIFFEVHTLGNWQNAVINHRRYLITKINEVNNASAGD